MFAKDGVLVLWVSVAHGQAATFDVRASRQGEPIRGTLDKASFKISLKGTLVWKPKVPKP